MRAKANELQYFRIVFPIDQHQVRPYVAIAMVFPVAYECMIMQFLG